MYRQTYEAIENEAAMWRGRREQWTEQSRMERVMKATGCDADTAREYLMAEEGHEDDAILSWRTDNDHAYKMR